MLRRTTLRYLTGARLGERLLTTATSSTTTPPTSTTPTSASKPASTSTPASQSSEYTAGTVKPAQQWHKKTDGSSSSGIPRGEGSGRRPSRGGQNLSARYARLENAVRSKQARAEAHAVNVSGAAATVAATSIAMGTATATAIGAAPDTAGEASVVTTDTVPVKKGKPVEIFHGLVVPEEPKPPADDECCMSGCAVCVYDLHEEELEAYDSTLTTLRASLVALGVPQAEWPARVQPAPASQSASTFVNEQANSSATSQSQDKSRKGAVLSAFEEMERRLAEKHRGEAQAEAGSGSGAGTGAKAESGMDKEKKERVQAQAVASISPNGQELDRSVNTILTGNAVPHWRERQQLAAKTQQAARRRTFWTELYEGVRWALFSNR